MRDSQRKPTEGHVEGDDAAGSGEDVDPREARRRLTRSSAAVSLRAATTTRKAL